ncbi:MAG: cupin domain-containing protein [Roseovarius sp.]|jgi:mannose-6-phosphate isomerase-like protein (cupin superfamily)|uniref:cupin domain-containing protein n=1 Tax=Roseovarius sp. TaxID=1486281 RepID=UPI0032EE82C7
MIMPETGARGLINGFTTIPPNGGIPLHYHNCEESVLVVSGSAIAEIEGRNFEVDTSDVVWIEAGIPHRFLNPSTETPLRIFWTYASAEASRTIVVTGEERRVVSEGK